MQMGFAIFMRMFQDKCNHDYNRDYFQCNHNWLHCDLFSSHNNEFTIMYVEVKMIIEQ